MAKTVLKDCFISVNGVTLSDHVDEVTIEDTSDEVEVTAFNPAGAKEFLKGMSDATITLSFFQDFAAAKVHATLQPLKASETPFPMAIRPIASAAISPTNPEMQMQVLLFTYSPLAGAVGEASKLEATFRNATSTGLVYDTTP